MLHVGHGNHVQKSKIMAIVVNKGQALQSKIKTSKDTQRYIDCTQGRVTRSLIFLSNGQVLGSSIETVSLLRRFEGNE